MATAVELFSDYNYYRLFTRQVALIRAKGKWYRYIKSTPDRIAALTSMDVWCQEQRYDSRHWLCWLFYRNKWNYARPFHQLVPTSKRATKTLHKAYGECGYLAAFDRRMREIGRAQKMAAAQVYDGNRDLAASTEALKRRYMVFGDSDGCFSDTRAKGYHPKSLVCLQCALAGSCAQKLRATAAYDIIGLRMGGATVEQVKREVSFRV